MSPQTDSLTRQLIRQIRAKPVNGEDLRWAALLMLDGIANAAAGCRTEQGRILRDWAAGRSGDAGRRALEIGGLMHILEMDDLHRASVVHPGCVVLPAVLALSEGTTRSGKDILRAAMHGFEATARVGMAAGPLHYKIWHNTATCGPYGGAMAAAALLGLDLGSSVHALGNAGTQSAGLWQFLETGAMSKHLHAGRAAEAGVVAAELAARGFTGPPRILEGTQGFFAATCPDADPGAVTREPDRAWAIHETSIKPWPSCRHTHPVIDAALELSSKLGGADIAAVAAATYAPALDVCDRPEPASAYEAKFSLQHCVAAALSDGRVDFASFEDDARARLGNLRARVSVSAGEPYVSAYPVDWGGEVRVRTSAGDEMVAIRNSCKGDPEAALDEAEMLSKARMLLDFAGIDGADPLIDGVLALADDAPLPALPF